MGIKNNVTETSNFIIAELAKRDITGTWWHTGGGCTMVQVELAGEGTDGDTAVIMITNGDSQVDLTPESQDLFTGWLAIHYATEDDALYGENEQFVHGTYPRPANAPVIDWKQDAVKLADAIALFIEDLRK